MWKVVKNALALEHYYKFMDPEIKLMTEYAAESITNEDYNFILNGD